MSDEEKTTGDATGTAAVSAPLDQPDLDEHTTEPNAPLTAQEKTVPAGGKWQMPKPKFQQTSGYLPQGYLKDMNQAAAAAKTAGSEDTTQEQAPVVAAVADGAQDGAVPSAPPAIEPQPDLSEQLIDDEPVDLNAAPRQRSGSGTSIPLIALMIIGLMLFAVVFLAAVYFLYIRQPGGDGIF